MEGGAGGGGGDAAKEKSLLESLQLVHGTHRLGGKSGVPCLDGRREKRNLVAPHSLFQPIILRMKGGERVMCSIGRLLQRIFLGPFLLRQMRIEICHICHLYC